MLTFREFYQICEGKKPDTPPHAVPGTYKRDSEGTISYTLQSYDGPLGKPKKKEIDKLVVKRSGGKAVTDRIKKLAKSVKKIDEDLEQRRQDLRQRQFGQMQSYKQKVADYKASQREKQQASSERETLKREIKRELQTEQTPHMEPNYYNQQIARRQATQKTAQIKHVHQEIGAEARAQQSQKRAEMKAIMSR
jgi:chromosome segregation ATPase